MKTGGFPERNWRRRGPRILFLAAALPLLATIARPVPQPPAGAGNAMLAVSAIPFDGGDRARRRAGSLLFLAGWSLASDDWRFGGISGMHVGRGEVVAISDTGVLLRFPLPGARTSLPIRFDPLVEGPGPRSRKANRDIEALLVRGGRIWAAFERHNMIWRYDLGSLRAESAARPEAMRRWRGNRGSEALVRLGDGRFLVFAEGRDDGAMFSDAVLFSGDPSVPGIPAARLRYRRPPGFRATDAALLPDGRILILNRRFRLLEGWSARLVVADVGGGGTIEGREIAALEAPLAVDNMEALSVTVEDGRTIVWIASDDNFSPLQRTLLLKFELTA
ncbi:MAG TPA: esterase-like activity of phytase family protein [Allosphingosinicella sp.]|nr:esterase-like activity of phytase family protein [Allosphingosinicella sp.]